MASAVTLSSNGVTLVKKALNSLTAILKKAEASPKGASLAQARLVEDMLPLTFQAFMVADCAQKCIARTTGTEPLSLDRNITTFEQMYDCIRQASEIVDKADKELVDKRAGETVPIGMGKGKNFTIASANYVNGYALPNIFFHLNMAYAIARKEGVELTKPDYQSSFLTEYLIQ